MEFVNAILTEEQQAATWSEELAGAGTDVILRWASDVFRGRTAFATSLGLEDQVLIDQIMRFAPTLPVFTLDTGRLFPESRSLLADTERRYGIRIRTVHPEAAAVERFAHEHGTEAHRQSVELRQACCRVRKVEPLRRALAGLGAWICGLRRGQAVTRRELEIVEWDASLGLFKINPLANWTEAQVWDYVRARDVPYNPLHDQGYPSIGCACCTRAIAPGEDIRAGRWWWENPEHKECGLHARDYRARESRGRENLESAAQRS